MWAFLGLSKAEEEAAWEQKHVQSVFRDSRTQVPLNVQV